jgi:chorismate mutase
MSAEKLNEYRNSIDNLDAILVHTLAERFRVTTRVGALKRSRGMPPQDPAREVAQLDRLRNQAQLAGLDPAVVDILFPVLFQEVRRRHAEEG